MRDWRTLMDLIEGLPRGSHYRAALADDDEVAELVHGTGGVRVSDRPQLAGWTDTMDRLANVEALLTMLLYKGTGEKPALPKRPETALDRVETRNIETKRNTVLGQLLPGR